MTRLGCVAAWWPPWELRRPRGCLQHPQNFAPVPGGACQRAKWATRLPPWGPAGQPRKPATPVLEAGSPANPMLEAGSPGKTERRAAGRGGRLDTAGGRAQGPRGQRSPALPGKAHECILPSQVKIISYPKINMLPKHSCWCAKRRHRFWVPTGPKAAPGSGAGSGGPRGGFVSSVCETSGKIYKEPLGLDLGGGQGVTISPLFPSI